MSANNLARNDIARHFDRAAGSYDQAASVQARVARHLAQKANEVFLLPPAHLLDAGCGTGFVAAAARELWPQAHITGFDNAPAMLEQAGRKMPDMRLVAGDIAAMEFAPAFDLVLSSMALHWLPDPRAALMRWQKWLKPHGRLFAALLVDGSFAEWRDLCAAAGLADGLWPMPCADFADDFACAVERQDICIDYASAQDFLRHLKATGAAASRRDHRPFGTAIIRRLLAHAPQPFTVTYRALYIEAPAPVSI